MRIQPPDIEIQHTVVSAEDFKADWDRGYCLIETYPESVETLHDRRSGKSIEINHSQQIMYRCMKCQFDVGDSALAAKDGKKRTAKEVILEHLRAATHPWPYAVFTNPYGHDADVTISGINHYAAEIGGLT